MFLLEITGTFSDLLSKVFSILKIFLGKKLKLKRYEKKILLSAQKQLIKGISLIGYAITLKKLLKSHGIVRKPKKMPTCLFVLFMVSSKDIKNKWFITWYLKTWWNIKENVDGSITNTLINVVDEVIV